MKNSINKFMMTLAVLLNVLLIVTAGCSAEKTTDESQKKGETVGKNEKAEQSYVAMVNGTPILKSEVDRKIDLIKKRYSEAGNPIPENQLAVMRQKIINSLVDQELLYKESQTQGISIDPSVINNDYDSFKKQFKTEDDFNNQMKALNYTEDVIKAQIKMAKSIQKLIEKDVISTISIPDEELKAYYDSHPDEFKHPERIRASHILVKVDQNATEADKKNARKKIDGILAKLKKKEDFAKLAEENSDDPGSSKHGGDLGFFTHGQMVKPFEDAAFALKPGEISKVVETQFGYHIIRLENKEPAYTQNFDEAKDGLQQKLKQEKISEAVRNYIESLKKKGKVEIVQSDVTPPAEKKADNPHAN